MRTGWKLLCLLGLIGLTGSGFWAGLVVLPPPPLRDQPIKPWSSDTSLQRIVAFGTSLTAGNSWPERLEARLTQCLGRPVKVQRVAAPGQGSAWALEQLAQVIAIDPEVVLIEFAINDADLRDGVSRRTARHQHSVLIETLEEALPEARLVLMTMSPATGSRGAMRPFLAAYYADVALLAEARGLGLVDLYPRWRRSDMPAPADGLHPNDSATRAVIDAPLLDAFTNALPGGCEKGDFSP